MQAILIGYFPRKIVDVKEWCGWQNSAQQENSCNRINEICSAAFCSSSPKNWIGHWKHNEMWVYDTPELARSIISPDEKESFQLYAYRVFPTKFHEGAWHRFEIPPLEEVAPLPVPFEKLGLDVVSDACSSIFGHSPLSCNGLAATWPVNRYCLVDDLESALKLGQKCEETKCEPGPYFIVEVWREKK